MIHIMNGWIFVICLLFSSIETKGEEASTCTSYSIHGFFPFKADTSAPASFAEKVKKTLGMEAIEKKTKEYFKYALKFDLPIENVSNLSLFDFISDWYGTRYIFGGNSKKGVDCSGFTRQLAKDVLSMDLPRKAQEQFSKCVRIEKNDLKPGDFVFFETYRKGISHVGYYLGDNKFIHAASHKGVTIDNLEDPYYKKIFRSGGRLKEVQ